jgi:hypothetical protein
MFLLKQVRETLRDPFYRLECRQASGGSWFVTLVIVLIASPLTALGAVLILAPIIAAESIFIERERNTLESLILTTTDRERLLWAKLLGRMNIPRLAALSCPFIGAVIGWLLGFSDIWGVSAILGFTYGLLFGASLLAGCLARGAYGIKAAIRSPSRLRVTSRNIWSPIYLLAFEVLAIVGICSLFGASAYICTLAAEEAEVLVLLPVTIGAGTAAVAAKILILNAHIIRTAIEETAAQMDEYLLDGRTTTLDEKLGQAVLALPPGMQPLPAAILELEKGESQPSGTERRLARKPTPRYVWWMLTATLVLLAAFFSWYVFANYPAG